VSNDVVTKQVEFLNALNDILNQLVALDAPPLAEFSDSDISLAYSLATESVAILELLIKDEIEPHYTGEC